MSERLELVEAFARSLNRDLKKLLWDEHELAEFRARLEPVVSADFHVELVGPKDSGFSERYEGIDGFIDGWRAWSDPYETYLYEATGATEIGDAVILDGKQSPTLPSVLERVTWRMKLRLRR